MGFGGHRWGGWLVVLLGLFLANPAHAFAQGHAGFGVFVGSGFHHLHHVGPVGVGHPGFGSHPHVFGHDRFFVGPPVVIVPAPVVVIPPSVIVVDPPPVTFQTGGAGQWQWTGSAWAWIPADSFPVTLQTWVPGQWQWTGATWAWVPGHWR